MMVMKENILLSIAMITVRNEHLTGFTIELVLRVYDRGSLVNNGKPHYTLQHQLKQHRNRNWPIKSSFYCGQQCESFF